MRGRSTSPGLLSLVSTPIGNLEDMTFRAVRVLREADLIAAEDTRAARVLLTRYEIARPVLSYFEGNEPARARMLLGRLQEGARVALISQAGTPALSDPGFRLIAQAAQAGIRVEPIPGASALLAAWVGSGLPTDRVLFLGFPPRGSQKRRVWIGRVRAVDATLVFYEAPGRVGETLGDLLAVLGDRPAALARELTKVHEEFIRGTLTDLAARFANDAPRGEVTLVVGGAADSEPACPIDCAAAVRAALGQGRSPREIAAELAVETGKSRRAIYQLAITLKRGQPDAQEPDAGEELEKG